MSQNTSAQAETLQSQMEDYGEELLLDMYRRMQEIREFEQKASELSSAGELPGPVHLYTGQEAVAVGTCFALGEDDIIGSTHRGHGHVLAKGADIDKMMAEIAGKEDGLNQGRGGSMHMVDFSLGIFGCNAIVGASVPHVAGAILSSRLDGDDRVGVSFFGDGASNEGVVHETMNMAAVWDLPVIFLCENNRYAVSTSSEYAVAGNQISDRAAGYGFPGWTIDGQNVLTVYEEIQAAVKAAREDRQPRLIECETLRYSGHFSGEKELAWLEDRPYRPDGEVNSWKEERDPISTFREALITADIVASDRLDQIETEIATEIDEAAEAAMAGDYPPAERALEDVYTDQDYPYTPATKYR